MRVNGLRRFLEEGGTAFGTGILELSGRGLPHALASAGMRFVLICMEHSAYGFETVLEMVGHAHAAGLTPIVRIPELSEQNVSRLLDNDCQSLLLPRVKTPSEVRRFIELAKYHPQGNRGCAIQFGGATDYEDVDVVTAMAHANANTLLGVMVETREAVENLDGILVRGIDFALVGYQDLSQSYGVPGRYEDPRILEAQARVRELCRDRGIVTVGFADRPEGVSAAVERGDRLVVYGNDLFLIRSAARAGLASVLPG